MGPLFSLFRVYSPTQLGSSFFFATQILCICSWFLFFAGFTPQHNLGRVSVFLVNDLVVLALLGVGAFYVDY